MEPLCIYLTIKYVSTMRQDVSKATMSNLRKRYQIAFRRWIRVKSGGRTIAPYIGADVWVVRNRLQEMMFHDMNWNNYGSKWVIDHIVPLRLFDMTNEEELRICLHYKNLMPLYREDNLYKEGAIEFTVKVLEKIPPCEIVNKLKEKATTDSSRLNKYLLKYDSKSKCNSLEFSHDLE